MRCINKYTVVPRLPEKLAGLLTVANNMAWCWNHEAHDLFFRIDRELWQKTNQNPRQVLGEVSQYRLDELAQDDSFLAQLDRVLSDLIRYLKGNHWSDRNPHAPKDLEVAYFSAELGIHESLRIYSGGLGVLAGDHLKAASDLAVPLIGVGLLYREGYFSQYLNADGWQQEHTPVNDFYSLPVTPATRADGTELIVDVLLGGATVYLKVWRIDVGRVKLFLLDSNIPQNVDPDHRDITGQLYAGGPHKRISQEIVLGIGGLRALRELGLAPTVFHMNEGHAAFQAIERMRVLMDEQGLTWEEALEASRNSNVFTTHTPVPAGIDLFDGSLIQEYFGEYCRRARIRFEDLVALGRSHGADAHEPFSMAVCALRTSAAQSTCASITASSRSIFTFCWSHRTVRVTCAMSVTLLTCS